MNEKEQFDEVFEDLQSRMEEKFKEYSNPESNLYPFYLFGIDKLDFNDAVAQITDNFNRQIKDEQDMIKNYSNRSIRRSNKKLNKNN